MGLLRVARAEAGARVRAEAGLTRALVAGGAIALSAHLVQHVVEGIVGPGWFFALGVVGAVGLWVTAVLWPRGSDGVRTLALFPLGIGLVWGGLAMHATDAADEGLTATHATGVLAGVVGVALLAIAAARSR